MDQFIDFFHKNLDKFRDDPESIRACFDYYLHPDRGGYFFAAYDENNNLIGATIILKTHMKGFLPENFLVYIATRPEARGKGVGGALINAVTKNVKGDVCLHVEHDNPAVKLYRRKNFTSKYLEMRLHK